MHILFIDTNAAICHQWIKQLEVLKQSTLLKRMPRITIHNLLIHDLLLGLDHVPNETKNGIDSTYVVTPSNSLLYMGGGFDQSLLQLLLIGTGSSDYKRLEKLIQNQALNRYKGYVAPNTIHPVSLLKTAGITQLLTNSLALANWNITELIQIPSMVVPSKIEQLETVFDFMWGLLNHLSMTFTTATSQLDDHSNVVIPGIGTGYGQLDTSDVAKVMMYAVGIFHLELDHLGENQQHLARLILILFLLRKNYRLLENEYDLLELESLMTDKGRYYDFDSSTATGVPDWESLLLFVRTEV